MSNDPRALTTLSAADYEAIEQAVMETARGRWFLKEFAARNRNSDTTVLLDAIGRLERSVTGERALEHIERVRFDLLEMAKSIAGLKIELDMTDGEGAEPNRFGAATSALDAIVQTTERATSDILGAAEHVQEIAWSLREQQFDESICDNIDRLATEIYTACGFQDLTAQRTQKVVQTLRFLEGRINALVDAWAGGEAAPRRDEAAAPGPQPQSVRHGNLIDAAPAALPDLSQSDVDIVIIDEEFETAGMPANVKAALSAASEIASEAANAEAWQNLADMAGDEADREEPDGSEDLLADDSQVLIIDDVDMFEIDFLATNEEADRRLPDLEAEPERQSLAQIDALPAAEKARLFG